MRSPYPFLLLAFPIYCHILVILPKRWSKSCSILVFSLSLFFLYRSIGPPVGPSVGPSVTILFWHYCPFPTLRDYRAVYPVSFFPDLVCPSLPPYSDWHFEACISMVFLFLSASYSRYTHLYYSFFFFHLYPKVTASLEMSLHSVHWLKWETERERERKR